jgi:hypothetical protein
VVIKDTIKSFVSFIVGVAILSFMADIGLVYVKILPSSNINISHFFIFILLQSIIPAALGWIVASEIIKSDELFWKIFLTAILTAIGVTISLGIYMFFSKIFLNF